MNNVIANIHADSGNHNWGTPLYIRDLAILTMGSIDLDPASSISANKTIVASHIFTSEDDGLKHDWFGNVWLNHPFSKRNNKLWPSKLINEYTKGNVIQACCITFASTSEKWFKPLMSYSQVYISGRVNYINIDTGLEVKGVTKGSVITYLGDDIKSFIYYFKTIGDVMLPAKKYYKG